MPTNIIQFIVNVIVKLFSIFLRQSFQKRFQGCVAGKLNLLIFLSSYFPQRSEKLYSYLRCQLQLRLYSVLLTVWLMVSSIVCPCT